MLDTSNDRAYGIEAVNKSYFNLDEIITCASMTSCSCSRTLPKEILALVNHSEQGTNTSKGHKAEVPLFLAETFHRTGIGMVHLSFPFNNRLREALLADSRSVDLEALHHHFYRLGRHLVNIVEESQAQGLADTLLHTFLQRVGQIIIRSLNSNEKPTKLDSTEKLLYAYGMYTEAQFRDWFDGVDEGCKRRAESLKVSV
uniref:DNA replication complex GINS protein PSF3 n=1 Tax=Syphacia muris TaxID=451379 RepID=A0A0N5AL94_9BILA